MEPQKLCGLNSSHEVIQSGFLSPCFIHLWLVCPVHTLMAAINVFYIAKHHSNSMCPHQNVLKANRLLSMLVVFVVVTEIACLATDLQKYHPTSYYLSITFIAFAWLLTFMYMQRKNRPPLLLCAMLILSSGTTVIELSALVIQANYTHINNNNHRIENYCIIFRLLLQTLGLVTLVILRIKWVPNKLVNRRLHAGIQAEASETDKLLGSEDFRVYYSSLAKQQSSAELSIVDENSDMLSRTTFWWVYKLMKKGLKGKLETAEDLFHLPPSLSTKEIAVLIQRILKSVNKSVCGNDSCHDVGEKQSILKKHLLLKALHQGFGARYYSIGILKFLGDCLGFAGPLLLHALVSFMENENVCGCIQFIYIINLNLFVFS